MLRDVDKSLNISFIRVKCQESVTELVMPTLLEKGWQRKECYNVSLLCDLV